MNTDGNISNSSCNNTGNNAAGNMNSNTHDNAAGNMNNNTRDNATNSAVDNAVNNTDVKSEAYNFFAMLSRMKYINRWNLMRNTIEENIAEHSLDVGIIAHALGVINNVYFNGKVDPNRIAVVAMYHDVPEIITGDLPTPVKYYSSEVKEAYDKVEYSAVKKLVRALPEEMKDIYKDIITGDYIDDESKKLVKAADKISALIKCVDERNMGNTDFERAERATVEIIKDLNCKEADFFMEKFFGGYSLTLDEQQE